jgi:8-oxo-dGTP diphosphatase
MDDSPQFGVPTSGVTPTERPGAYAIVIRDDRVLIVPTPAGLYLPGGGIERDESAEATLLREVREETGYDVVTAIKLGTARQYVRSGINKIETFYAVTVSGSARQGESDHVPCWLPVTEAISGMAEEAQAWAIRLIHDVRET